MRDEKGPIHGVKLITSLPLGGGFTQAMPSRSDLRGVKDYMQGQRVVAGYEVLLSHWRRQADQLARHTGSTVPLELEKALTDYAREIDCQVGQILNGPAAMLSPEEYDRARALLVTAEQLVRRATEIATGEAWESDFGEEATADDHLAEFDVIFDGFRNEAP